MQSSSCNALALIKLLMNKENNNNQRKPDPEPPLNNRWTKMIQNTMPRQSKKIKSTLPSITKTPFFINMIMKHWPL